MAFDRGSEHLRRSRARFAKFQEGKAEQQVFDPIGRAWAVGLLENDRIDPAVLRDAGRDYAARYWGYYPTAGGVASYDGDSRRRGHVGEGPDPMGEAFTRIEELLKAAGRAAHEATQSLCLDFYWFPDDNPAWLDRLINTRLIAARVDIHGQLSTPGDGARLMDALSGLLALAEGVDQRKSRAA